LTSLER